MQKELKKTEELVDKIQDQIQDMNEVSAYSLQKNKFRSLQSIMSISRRPSLPPPKLRVKLNCFKVRSDMFVHRVSIL